MAGVTTHGIRVVLAALLGSALALLLVACEARPTADPQTREQKVTLGVGDSVRVGTMDYELASVVQKEADAAPLLLHSGGPGSASDTRPQRAKSGSRFVVVTLKVSSTNNKSLDPSLIKPHDRVVEADGVVCDTISSRVVLQAQDPWTARIEAEYEIPLDSDQVRLSWTNPGGSPEAVVFALR